MRISTGGAFFLMFCMAMTSYTYQRWDFPLHFLIGFTVCSTLEMVKDVARGMGVIQ